jgi:DNA-binding PadR family transcriptional regulator
MATPPLREPTFLILTSLAAGPRHGYGILQDVTELSEGRVTLRAGTLYGSLDRLVEQGLVAPDREEVEQGRLRRYYRITGDGRELLTAEAARMDANARAASRRLGLARTGIAPGGTILGLRGHG